MTKYYEGAPFDNRFVDLDSSCSWHNVSSCFVILVVIAFIKVVV